jgi:hypothetical protein
MAEVILTTPGPGTWIVPAGVTAIQVECWGGGGSGGYRATANGCASGGGAGGYAATYSLAVSPGQTVYYHVGAGGAARSGTSQAGADGERTWLNKGANASPAAATSGAMAAKGENGNQGSTIAGGASLENAGIGDLVRVGRNNGAVQGTNCANGGAGASTPAAYGNAAAAIPSGSVDAQVGGAPAASGGYPTGGLAGGGDGGSDPDGGAGGGGTITGGTTGGDGGLPGAGGGGAVFPATASGAGGGGQIRITYTAAPTAAARRVAVVMM